MTSTSAISAKKIFIGNRFFAEPLLRFPRCNVLAAAVPQTSGAAACAGRWLRLGGGITRVLLLVQLRHTGEPCRSAIAAAATCFMQAKALQASRYGEKQQHRCSKDAEIQMGCTNDPEKAVWQRHGTAVLQERSRRIAASKHDGHLLAPCSALLLRSLLVSKCNPGTSRPRSTGNQIQRCRRSRRLEQQCDF